MKLNNALNPENKKIRVLLTYLFVGLCLLILYRWYENHEKLVSQTKIQAEIVGNNISAAVIFKDINAINETLSSLSFDKNIKLACLYNTDNNLISLYANRQTDIADTCHSDKDNLFTLSYISDIFASNEKIGSIRIKVSTSYIYKELIFFTFVFVLIGVFITSIAILNTQHINKKIKSYDLSIKEMINRNELALEDQHKKIAIEIHDQIGQLLTTSMLNLQIASKNNPKEHNQTEVIQKTYEVINEAYLRIKDISASLHPSILKFGLCPAIEWLAEKSFSMFKISWNVNFSDPFKEPDSLIGLTLFRICQETFSNITKHAQAKNVLISIEQIKNKLILTIEDDGVGFDIQKIESRQSLGLIGISERAKGIGASIEIISENGQGTKIQIIV